MADENLPAFTQQLDENLRTDERLTQFNDKTISDVVRGHFELGEKLKTSEGAREGMVKIPGEDASDTDRHAFFTKLGKPDAVDKYEFEKFDLPGGREPDKALIDKIRKTAFDKNVPAGALKALHKTVVEHGLEQSSEISRQIKAQDEKDDNALKNIWAGDTYKENSEKSKRVFDKLMEKMTIPEELGGKEAMLKEFQDIGFLGGDDGEPGGNAKLKYFLSNMFGLIGEDVIIPDAGDGSAEKTDEQRRADKFPEMVNKN